MKRKQIATASAPGAVGPYSQGNAIGNLVFTAGQIGLDPATGQFVSDDVQDQTRRALTSIMQFFEEPYPARSAVAAKDLPLGALVEIEAIAVKSE
jgi:2-iminobutanoate/2-iminopropanoate deaminase